jgi:hypothetical protein
LDLGLGISTNRSEVVDLGTLGDFSALSGRISVGQPAPAAWDNRRVANPDSIGPFRYDQPAEGIFIGPLYPTHFITPGIQFRVPGNILFAARGEYRGGFYREVNEISISRSVRSPLCFPYYQNPESSIALKSDTPAIWRERCTPANGDDYWFDADYFKLRTVTATFPLDRIFPEGISNPSVTFALANIWDWYREIPWYDIETGGDAGSRSDAVASQSERTPAPATFRISLRVTF